MKKKIELNWNSQEKKKRKEDLLRQSVAKEKTIRQVLCFFSSFQSDNSIKCNKYTISKITFLKEVQKKTKCCCFVVVMIRFKDTLLICQIAMQISEIFNLQFLYLYPH